VKRRYLLCNSTAGALSPKLKADSPIRIGVSACLLGHEVRFDGGEKRDAFLVETLGRFVEFVPVCPEFEIGLGVPRETLRLERNGSEVRLIAPRSLSDHTEAMRTFAAKRADGLARKNLSGYVLKRNSPSCGMDRVRIYGASGAPSRNGRGLFAAALIDRFPHLPVEDEGRLNDARVRENFIERVFAYHRLRNFFTSRWTNVGLIAFHTAHKLQLMAHSPRLYRELGRTVAEARGADRGEVREAYESIFMQALQTISTPARHANVLQHIAGYFRDHLDTAGRRELASLIVEYRDGLRPLVAPIALIRRHVERFEITYLAGQTYLEPHPKELMVRNHA
jgi:uncharacterized protein YbgA (DUF1722 family)/uncharacterized protein YbbK (DUF523 family)